MFVEYYEPHPVEGHVTVRVTTEKAVAEMRERASARGHHYQSDQEALEDFCALHWASVVG